MDGSYKAALVDRFGFERLITTLLNAPPDKYVFKLNDKDKSISLTDPWIFSKRYFTLYPVGIKGLLISYCICFIFLKFYYYYLYIMYPQIETLTIIL